MTEKIITTVTAMRSRAGTRIAYTHSEVDANTGQITRRNIRGTLTLTKGMETAAAAVRTIEDFLTEKLPDGEKPGVLTSFCIFRTTEGITVTYMYDEIDEVTGRSATKNNQASMILVEGHMDEQITAAAELFAFAAGRL